MRNFRIVLFILLTAGASPVVADDGDVVAVDAGNDRERGPNFVGLELGPGILNAVQKQARMRDWTQREIDAYYQVLDFARRTNLDEQRAKARENVLAEIERIREKVEDDYKRRMKKIEAAEDDLNALQQTRAKAAAAQFRMRGIAAYEDYREHPREFPLFVQMTNSMVRDAPSRFHGKLVTLTGHIRKLISYDARKNDFGVTQLHEAWLYTKDSQHNPTVVVFTDLPDGVPTGENLSEAATVTGYVYRLHYYEDKDGRLTRAPMLLAATIEWEPHTSTMETPLWMKIAVAVAVVLIFAAVVAFVLRDGAARKRRFKKMMSIGRPPEVDAEDAVRE